MELFVNAVDSAPIATKLGAKGRGKCQLSFALPFSFIEAFSSNNNLKFSLQFLAGHMQLLGRYLCQCCHSGDPRHHIPYK
jgi:hypothetical protein